MPNMKKDKTPMREQLAVERIKNFDEVPLGYSIEEAQEEAARCIQCKTRPCVAGCPVEVPIPEFIDALLKKDIEEAYKIILETNRLPAVCGRVCPQESQCEEKCVRGIKNEPVAIGRLERFVADYAIDRSWNATSCNFKKNGIKMAVIGSGPAGLTCAGELAQKGYSVTIFEVLHSPGGVLMYGIPEFRLPKKLVQKEIKNITDMGVEIEKNVIVGKSITIDELMTDEGFESVFIGTGAGLPSFLNIEGENLNRVYSANEFLTRANLMKAYDFPNNPTPLIAQSPVIVVGGGNVAMDAARTARRLGAEVYVVYRRSEQELPARLEEVHHAKEEGIIFKMLTSPVKIVGQDGWATGMECVEMELGEPDNSGRRRPIEKKGSNFVIDAKTIIVSIGTSPNPLIKQTTPDIETNKWGCVVVDEKSLMTTKPGVFAGGDIVTGAATVILAMGAGRQAATAMDEYVKEKKSRAK